MINEVMEKKLYISKVISYSISVTNFLISSDTNIMHALRLQELIIVPFVPTGELLGHMNVINK